MAELEAEMTRRGLQHSAPKHFAQLAMAARCLAETINDKIEIRREMIRTAPDLGSDAELNALLSSIEHDLTRFANKVPDHPLGTDILDMIAPTLTRQREQSGARMRSDARLKIKILKKETALNMHKQPIDPANITIGDGPVIINYGKINGDVQQVIGNVQRGDPELAALLGRLADAIVAREDLGEKRVESMEQVAFIAEQAAAPAKDRQPASVLKAVVASLRKGLEDTAHFAEILALTGPAIARHFGLAWPF